MSVDKNVQATQIGEDEKATRPDLKVVERKTPPPPPGARELRFGDRAVGETISSIDAYINAKYPPEKAGDVVYMIENVSPEDQEYYIIRSFMEYDGLSHAEAKERVSEMPDYERKIQYARVAFLTAEQNRVRGEYGRKMRGEYVKNIEDVGSGLIDPKEVEKMGVEQRRKGETLKDFISRLGQGIREEHGWDWAEKAQAGFAQRNPEILAQIKEILKGESTQTKKETIAKLEEMAERQQLVIDEFLSQYPDARKTYDANKDDEEIVTALEKAILKSAFVSAAERVVLQAHRTEAVKQREQAGTSAA